ncbi:hypothetical protein AA0111_g1726 [Alternaria arborescens]|uniref:hypothetical protein n=1 Tax=Alternaria arborescens TaxID=156630 RepID=UPI001074B964|nr:hypothetical protein AA0111_g1726 [Alternaria arborescens]RYO39526.1 hypothetical protein AA0111_g1726 [Alternaria arborescens]
MKAFSAILIVLASVGLADAADFCAPQSKSCIKLPQASAKVCSSLISKAGLKLTTCSKPKSTITKTTTVQPSTTQTVTVTQTASFTVATNVQRTIQKTVTSTTVSQTTLVQTATSTAQTTLIIPVTVTDSQDETITTTITSSIPYQQETCAAATPVVRKRQNNYKALDIIPRDCSCYLTRTTTCGQTTTTSTVTRPTSTVRVTQVKLTTVTKYNSKTSDVLQTATAVASAVSTDFSTTIIAITETHSLTSIVATITTTTTSTATATQTVQADPCADPVLYTSTRPDYPGSVWGVLSDSNNPKDCCYRCFGSNAGCLFWKFSNFVCTQYVIPNKMDAVSCITKSCRKGRPSLISAAGDGATYGVGICAAAGFSG